MTCPIARRAWWGAAITAPLILSSCAEPYAQIDHHVDGLLADGAASVGGGAHAPNLDAWGSTTPDDRAALNAERPATLNPAANEMTFQALGSIEADAIMSRLTGADAIAQDTVLTLDESLAWAVDHAFEHAWAEEEYVLSCLALLVERHLWTPQIADTVMAQYAQFSPEAADETKTSSAIVNDLSLSQRLPWGGQVAASFLTTFSRVVQNAGTRSDGTVGQLTLSASIPFLRGGGVVAREDIIQAERDLIYAARSFEDFRRSFHVEVVGAYLSLQVQQQELTNALESVALLDKLAERQRALYEAGRARLYDAAEAENNALQQRSQVSGLQESYRLAVDRFKILINYPVDLPVVIEQASFSISPPAVALDDAVRIALSQRLDLQTQRDRLVDRRRGVRNALNQLLPDLNLAGEVRFGGDDDYYDDFVLPTLENMESEISLTLGIPLDRTTERIAVRAAQVELERARRALAQVRDEVAVTVRNAARTIDSSLLTYDIQRRNVEIAQINIESIDADPDTYTVLDQLSAIQSLQQARNGRARAFKAVQQAILDYLLSTGQLRVTPGGHLDPLPGMQVVPTSALSFDADAA